MQQVIEFAGNHMILVAALGAAIVFIITTEIRLRGGAEALNAHEAVRLINDQDAVILDIRDPGEYKTSHVLNAVNVPLSRLTEDIGNVLKDKTRPVIIYCKTGNRSNEACKTLLAAGYQNVSQLKNGLFAWQDAGLPIEK